MSKLEIKRDGGKIYCPLTDSYHIETPEEKVRQEYIIKLVNDYGYSLDQMAQEVGRLSSKCNTKKCFKRRKPAQTFFWSQVNR